MNGKIPIFDVMQSSTTRLPFTPAASRAFIADGYNRSLSYVRLSITDLCNFKCTYCLPNGYVGKKRPNELSLIEIKCLVAGLAAVGIKKIRITGGEPSLRSDLPNIISAIKQTPGIEQVALTTNGYRLKKLFPLWQAAGLDILNVSVDSFDNKEFATITGVDALPEILAAIDLILAQNAFKIKLNAVLLKQSYPKLLEDALTYIKQRSIKVRMIELMRTGDHHQLFASSYLNHQILINDLTAYGFRPQIKNAHDGPAIHYSHECYQGEIGIIAPYSRDFCASCNRVRVSSMGKLHLCLYDCKAHDLRPYLAPYHHIELVNQLKILANIKPEAHRLDSGDSGLIHHLAQIGG